MNTWDFDLAHFPFQLPFVSYTHFNSNETT